VAVSIKKVVVSVCFSIKKVVVSIKKVVVRFLNTTLSVLLWWGYIRWENIW